MFKLDVLLDHLNAPCKTNNDNQTVLTAEKKVLFSIPVNGPEPGMSGGPETNTGHVSSIYKLHAYKKAFVTFDF